MSAAPLSSFPPPDQRLTRAFLQGWAGLALPAGDDTDPLAAAAWRDGQVQAQRDGLPAAAPVVPDCTTAPPAAGSSAGQMETHISVITLAPGRVLKLKKAITLPFLDFSTPALRRAACWQELQLNRRTAPDLYRRVRRLCRAADGALMLDDDPCDRTSPAPPEALDWLVEMERFDQAALFDHLAERNALTPALIETLAVRLAALHHSAPSTPDWGGRSGLEKTIRTNAACFAGPAADCLPASACTRLTAASLALLDQLSPRLEARRRNGLVRRCHGDLHLGNICLWQDAPTPFDAIEFCDDFACIDILYDLSFLLMDLLERGARLLANRLLNRWLEQSGDWDGTGLLPLFLSLRAAIRAHVCATQAAGQPAAQRSATAAQARRYLDFAEHALQPVPPCLIAVGGLSGCGKSALAAALAPQLGTLPGAVILRSDVLRKQQLGLDPLDRLPASAYSAASSEQVYAALLAQARARLADGQAVVLDAVALRPEERDRFAGLAAELSVPFAGLWLWAPAALLQERVERRRHNASDATAAVVHWQAQQDPGPLDWLPIDATGSRENSLHQAEIGLKRLGIPLFS